MCSSRSAIWSLACQNQSALPRDCTRVHRSKDENRSETFSAIKTDELIFFLSVMLLIAVRSIFFFCEWFVSKARANIFVPASNWKYPKKDSRVSWLAVFSCFIRKKPFSVDQLFQTTQNSVETVENNEERPISFYTSPYYRNVGECIFVTFVTYATSYIDLRFNNYMYNARREVTLVPSIFMASVHPPSPHPKFSM